MHFSHIYIYIYNLLLSLPPLSPVSLSLLIYSKINKSYQVWSFSQTASFIVLTRRLVWDHGKVKAKPLDEVGSHLKQKSGRYNDHTTTTTCFVPHFPNLWSLEKIDMRGRSSGQPDNSKSKVLIFLKNSLILWLHMTPNPSLPKIKSNAVFSQ